jgi:hypothetical protein
VTARRYWRVFPWDPAAQPGDRFSAPYIAGPQISGRFDLHDRPPVLYLAESPEHAVAEKLQRFRGRPLREAHLKEFGQVLALVEVLVPPRLSARIVDLTDPHVLAQRSIGPDVIASGDRQRTQALAELLMADGRLGLRWWSALTGDWHTTVLFMTPGVSRGLDYGRPQPLHLGTRSVREAADRIGLVVRRQP